jgi:hypothetical protein
MQHLGLELIDTFFPSSHTTYSRAPHQLTFIRPMF